MDGHAENASKGIVSLLGENLSAFKAADTRHMDHHLVLLRILLIRNNFFGRENEHSDLETSPHTDEGENLRATVAYVIHCLLPSNTYHLIWLTFQATFQRVHSEPGFTFSRTNLKGRSPDLRHVSRTHRVNLDWLFERINLDSSILFDMRAPQSKEVFLTKGAFTTLRWKSQLQLIDIYPPPKFECRPPRSRIILFCSLSGRTPTAPSATSKVGVGNKNWKILIWSALRLWKPSASTKWVFSRI